VCSDGEFLLDKVVLVGYPHEYYIFMYIQGLPNTTPNTQRGTTSSSTSSIKSTLIENLILDSLVTFIYASLSTNPNGYGPG